MCYPGNLRFFIQHMSCRPLPSPVLLRLFLSARVISRLQRPRLESARASFDLRAHRGEASSDPPADSSRQVSVHLPEIMRKIADSQSSKFLYKTRILFIFLCFFNKAYFDVIFDIEFSLPNAVNSFL